MKKGDIVIICTVAAAFVLSVVLLVAFCGQGSRGIIKQNNEIVYSNSISINKTVNIKTNTITVKDGEDYMSDSTCKNQICVNSGKISKKGESIICLPNKVTVEIK